MCLTSLPSPNVKISVSSCGSFLFRYPIFVHVGQKPEKLIVPQLVALISVCSSYLLEKEIQGSGILQCVRRYISKTVDFAGMLEMLRAAQKYLVKSTYY